MYLIMILSEGTKLLNQYKKYLKKSVYRQYTSLITASSLKATIAYELIIKNKNRLTDLYQCKLISYKE